MNLSSIILFLVSFSHDQHLAFIEAAFFPSKSSGKAYLRQLQLSSTSSNDSLAGKFVAQRFIYRLSPTYSFTNSPFQIEERKLYAIGEDGRTLEAAGSTSYYLRGKPAEEGEPATSPPPNSIKKNGQMRQYVHVGPVIHEIKHIREGDWKADHPGGATSGLGETIWDSSYALALYCTANPDLFKGHVLEVGSGVGLGGILSCIGASVASAAQHPEHFLDQNHPQSINSIQDHVTEALSFPLPSNLEGLTLSDVSEPSLNMCIDNISSSSLPLSKVHVTHLDWSSHIPPKFHGKFNLIIASDCAYYFPLVGSLARTVAYALAPSPYNRISNKQTIGGRFLHIGPSHRDSIDDLRKKLMVGYRMNTRKEDNIVLERFDLVPLLIGEELEAKSKGNDFGYLEYQNMERSRFSALIGCHHEDYDGYNGENFFPAETGKESSHHEGTNEFDSQTMNN